MNYWEKLLGGFSFKSKGGAPDFTNPNDRMLLRMELLKRGWNKGAVNELLHRLTEQEVQKLPVTGGNAKTKGGLQRYYFYDKGDNIVRARTDQYNQSQRGGNLPYATSDQVDDETIGKEDDNESGDNEKQKETTKVGKHLEETKKGRQDRFEKGFKKAPKKKSKDDKSAPGNAGSLLNEDGSNEVCERIVEDKSFQKLSEEEQVKILYNELKDKKLGQQNNKVKKSKSGRLESGVAGYLSVKDIPEDLPPDQREIYSKCKLAVRNGRRKAQKVQAISKKLGYKNPSVIGLGGTQDDLQRGQDIIDDVEKVVAFKNGKKVEIPKDKVKNFIKNSGGGENPSDTATIIHDEKSGEATILFHSDKDSLNALIAQTTQKDEWTGDVTTETLDKAVKRGDITEEQKIEILKVRTKYSYKLDEIESSFKLLSQEPSKKLLGGLGEDYDTQDVIDYFKTASSGANPDKYWFERVETVFGSEKISQKKSDGKPTKDAQSAIDFLNKSNPNRKPPFPDGDEPTDEQMLRAFLQKQSDEIPAGDDLNVVNRLNSKFGMVDQNEQRDRIEAKRKEALDYENQVLEEINQIGNVNGVPVGDALAANDIWDKGHFDAIMNPEGTVHEFDDMFEVNASGFHIDKKGIQECLGVDTKAGFQAKFIRGELQEQKSSQKRTTGGYYMVYAILEDKDGKPVIDPETGKQKRMEIMEKRLRTKQGETGRQNGVYNWGKGFKDCIGKKTKGF